MIFHKRLGCGGTEKNSGICKCMFCRIHEEIRIYGGYDIYGRCRMDHEKCTQKRTRIRSVDKGTKMKQGDGESDARTYI